MEDRMRQLNVTDDYMPPPTVFRERADRQYVAGRRPQVKSIY
jgi:hypothetical protein